MGKRKNILLSTLLPCVLLSVAMSLPGCRDLLPIPEDLIRPDSPLPITPKAVAEEPKADTVQVVRAVDTVRKTELIPNIQIPNIQLPEELEIAIENRAIEPIDSAELRMPAPELLSVTHYAFLSSRRVHTPALFVPKGQWFFGGTVAYTDHTNSNYKMLILEDWDGAGYTVTGRMYLGYAVKDNLGIGIKAGFERMHLRIDQANLNLGDDLSFGVNHVQYINQQWSGTVFMRNFLSLFKSRQFGLFNDLELTLGGGTGKMISGTGDALKGTYESVFKASVGISPGIMVFMHNIAAIEVSVGILGFNTTSSKQITNQVYQGSRRTSGAQFGIDLLSVKLGGTIYLNGRRFKQR